MIDLPKTLGELKKSDYKSKSIKDELRDNLIKSFNNKINPFEGILGYDETVIPDIQKALLSKHNIILLGLRGQAKTKIARLMVNLLDEYMPVIHGSELNEDPFNPISIYGINQIKENGENTKISWVHREERYCEKLATPDVTVADLIGDLDPIKAASQRLSYSDERIIHFGLIPRSHRGIFVINELPDLQARIQVALFNILQENDIQIRGFKVRLPLDIQFVFTANPEDYTNRGSIVTPLKDRIDSQILTHYPKSLEVGRQITEQEAVLSEDQKMRIIKNPLLSDLVEQVAIEARQSEFIDAKSGVSARLTISAYENLFSSAERRMLLNNETDTYLRITDLYGIIPSITGKIELVYEGEQEGPSKVAQILIGKAIKSTFNQIFPSPDKIKKSQALSPYKPIVDWFSKGNDMDLMIESSNKEYQKMLNQIPGLKEAVLKYVSPGNEKIQYLFMEFLLHGLAEHSLLSKYRIDSRIQFKDMLSSMFSLENGEDDDSMNSDFYK